MTKPNRRQFVQAIGAGAAMFAARPVFAAGRSYAPTATGPRTAAADVHLNYNESPYGPSPRALDAFHKADVAHISRYFPEDHYDTLCAAIARYHGVTPDHVRVTVGSTEVLKICDDVFLAGGAPLVVAKPAYEAVLQYAANSKAESTLVPLTADHRHDLPAMAAATTAGTGLVYICNPNNPTGTIVRKDEIAAFMARVPANVTVLVDEAYAEFVDDAGYESAVKYVKEGRNVIVAKTFSKIHGLAGSRVGYAIAKPELMSRIAPFTVDFAVSGATANAAIASLADADYLAAVRRKNAVERRKFTNEMRTLGFDGPESHANFAMVNLRRPVAPVAAEFAKRHILVGREFPALPTFLRVTFGTDSEMRTFYAAFREVVKA